jgi:hypothetical protein
MEHCTYSELKRSTLWYWFLIYKLYVDGVCMDIKAGVMDDFGNFYPLTYGKTSMVLRPGDGS